MEREELERELVESQRLAAERQAAVRARVGELAGQVEELESHRSHLGELEGYLEAVQQERDQAQRGWLEAHRRALLAEHRGQVVEELVQGDSVEALERSVERAKAAHAQVAEELRSQAAGHVGAGNPGRAEPTYEALSPQAKIAYGLRAQR